MDTCLRFSRSIFLSIILAAAAAFAQTTIRVPADQPTIQGAIAVANNGDTVLVSPGTYNEKINFMGKAITVTSTDGAATTILDGNGLGCCVSGVTFSNSETSASVLNGFTVQNFQGPPPQPAAEYGIEITGASPTITNNIITNNRGGSGINVDSGSPQIVNNSITSNYGSSGGGIFLNGSASALVQDNFISGNSAINAGGGIAVQSYGFPTQVPSTIQQNLIVNNMSGVGGSYGSGSGTGIYVQGTSAQLVNNTLYGNSSPTSDAGIFIDFSSGASTAPNVLVENNVVVNSGYGFDCGSNNQSITFSHNLAYNSNGGISWGFPCGSMSGTNGNLDADPRFVDALSGNFHLVTGSPAIDAGDITFSSLPTFDYAGAARLGDDSGQCNFVIDMGIYQSHSAAPGAISVSPSSLVFPDTMVGDSQASQDTSQTVTLTGNGPGCFRLTGINVTGDFSQFNLCGSGLAAGQTCTVKTYFFPTAAGLRSGMLSVQMNTNLGTAPGPVALSGTGFIRRGISSPTTLNFDQEINTTSSPQTVTITNSGTVPLTVSYVGISSGFLQTNNCSAPISPGANCSIQVTFTPTLVGQIGGTLSISSDSVPAVADVSLTGVGRGAFLSYSPASLNFGNQTLGTSSNAQSITLSNTGNETFTLSGFTMSRPDFTQTNNCPASIAVGTSCLINVVFVPGTTGVLSATLTATGSPAASTGTVNLSGTGTAPIASLSPTSLTFALQRAGSSSAAQAVTLSNTGTSALNISSIVINGVFAQTNNCPASLIAGNSCLINVTFQPTQSGAASGSVVVTDDSGGVSGSTQSVSLSGTGGSSVSAVTPANLTYTGTTVGTSSAPATVTINNTGTMPLTISSISIAGDFTQGNNCGTSVAAGASCIVNVTFMPTTAGTRAGTLTIIDDSQGATTQTVSLSGTGNVPTASVSPSSLTFALQRTGTSSAAQAVTLSNTGSSALNISSIVASGAFAQTNNCPASLAPGNSCSISVTFQPTQSGAASGSLVVTDDSGAVSGSTTAISLSGTAGASTAGISPSSLTFSSTKVGTSSASAPVTVSNTGTMPLNISSISASGDFTQSNNCGSSVAAGGSCIVNVLFSPSAVGSRTGILNINDDSQTGPAQTVSLSGTGVVPTASLSPATVSFALTAVGTQSSSSAVMLTNTGIVSMSVSSITVSGDFTQANNCPVTLAAGASCTINVSFAPTGSGTRTGTLTVTDDASGGSQTASLTGTATDFSVTVTPSSVTINSGQTANYTAKVSPIGGTYNQTVALSCSGLPANSSCTFNPVSLIPGSSAKNSTLKIVTHTNTTLKGTYTIVVTGTVNSITRSAAVTLIIAK